FSRRLLTFGLKTSSLFALTTKTQTEFLANTAVSAGTVFAEVPLPKVMLGTKMTSSANDTGSDQALGPVDPTKANSDPLLPARPLAKPGMAQCPNCAAPYLPGELVCPTCGMAFFNAVQTRTVEPLRPKDLERAQRVGEAFIQQQKPLAL